MAGYNPNPTTYPQQGGLGQFFNVMQTYNQLDPASRYMNFSYGGSPNSILGIALKLINARNKTKAENNTLKNYLDAMNMFVEQNKQQSLARNYMGNSGGGQSSSWGKPPTTSKPSSGGGNNLDNGSSNSAPADRFKMTPNELHPLIGQQNKGGGDAGASKPNPWASKGNVGYTVPRYQDGPHDPRYSGGGDQPPMTRTEGNVDVPQLSSPTGGMPQTPPSESEQNALAKELGFTGSEGFRDSGGGEDDGYEYAVDPETNEVIRKKKKKGGSGDSSTGQSLGSVSSAP